MGYRLRNLRTQAGLITFLWLAVYMASAFAGEAYIENVKLSYGEGYLRLTANIAVSFAGKIREIILSGLDTAFIFEIKIKRQNSLLPDEEIFVREIVHAVKYDTLKREYKVKLSEEDFYKENVTKDFQQMRKWMTSLTDIRTVSSGAIKQGERYVIAVRGKMRAIDLPFPLDYLNIFFHFEEFETPWSTLSIVYGA